MLGHGFASQYGGLGRYEGGMPSLHFYDKLFLSFEMEFQISIIAKVVSRFAKL